MEAIPQQRWVIKLKYRFHSDHLHFIVNVIVFLAPLVFNKFLDEDNKVNRVV